MEFFQLAGDGVGISGGELILECADNQMAVGIIRRRRQGPQRTEAFVHGQLVFVLVRRPAIILPRFPDDEQQRLIIGVAE